MNNQQMIDFCREKIITSNEVDGKDCNVALTLDGVMIALNNINQDYCYSNGSIELKYGIQTLSGLSNELICDWQPNTLLENQSEVTIKAIFDILYEEATN